MDEFFDTSAISALGDEVGLLFQGGNCIRDGDGITAHAQENEIVLGK